VTLSLSPEVASFFLFVVVVVVIVIVVYVLCFFLGLEIEEIEVHPEGRKEGSCSSKGDV
jgi:hypothetical protein